MLIFPSFFNAAAGGYEIEQSLLSSADNQNLKRTPATSGNKQTWTWSGWIKRGELGAEQHFFESWEGVGDVMTYARFHSNDTIRVKQFQSGDIFELQTNAVFRDPSAWYHVVLSFDTTQATSSDRAKIYVNGELQSLGTANYPSQNLETFVNQSGYIHHLFADLYTSSRSFNGYMAEVHLIDGTALAPTDFGETNADGVWIPKAFTGSHGTEGWYMKFDPTATNGIGHDHSGNGNNLTISNFTTSGTGTDVMSDTPTTNWCTLNPLSFGPSNADMVEGNLRFNQPTSTTGNAKGTIAVSSGKWYWEVTPQTTATANVAGGILGTAETDTASQPGNYATGYSYYSTGETRHNGVDATYGDSYGAGDVIGTALDLDAGTLVFYKNGVSQGTAYSSVSGTFVPAIGDTSTGSNSQLVCNFGQRAFAYTPPTGFKSLNSSNLPAPTVKDGSEYFNTVLYTGDGTSSRAITGMGFQADFLWLKPRSARNHSLVDVLRGTNHLQSNNTNAEASVPSFDSFDSDGFTVTADGSTNPNWNESPEPNVVWGWLAGGSGSSNTDGSITSTVSANPTAGFSIVSYTGTGSAATVGHGLGVAPNLIIVKSRNYSPSSNWKTYWSVLGDKYIDLNDPNLAYDAGANIWNDTAPTSTVFSIGTDSDTNYSSSTTYIAYCFAEVEGYSKFGSYTGNGSSDGPFIYTGFTPAFILVKWYADVNTAESWQIYDTKRLTYNPNDAVLYPDSATQEENPADRDVDILSNGFKWRAAGQQMNRSGASYIFAAFAEHPTGGSGVSPATAR